MKEFQKLCTGNTWKVIKIEQTTTTFLLIEKKFQVSGQIYSDVHGKNRSRIRVSARMPGSQRENYRSPLSRNRRKSIVDDCFSRDLYGGKPKAADARKRGINFYRSFPATGYANDQHTHAHTHTPNTSRSPAKKTMKRLLLAIVQSVLF